MFNLLMKANNNFDKDANYIMYQIHTAAFVDILLKNGVNADTYIFNGESFLFYEFRKGNVESIMLFLKNSKELGNKYKQLFIAIEENNIKTVNNIIKKGIDVNQTISGGLTPLCWAAYLGRYDIAKLLIKNNAKVSISWKKTEGNNPYPICGSDPLRWAIKNGHDNIVKLLIDHSALPIIWIKENQGLNVFHIAAINGNVTIMKMLMENYNSKNIGYQQNSSTLNDVYNCFYNINNISLFNYKNATPFSIAAYYGNIELCQLFLDNGIDVDNIKKEEQDYYTPLFFAVEGKQLETVKFLIKNGAKINSDNTIITECISNGTGELLNYLIENGAHINNKALLDIAQRFDFKTLKLVVSTSISHLSLKQNSFSLLCSVINNPQLNDKIIIIKYLINKGVILKNRDNNGTSLLHIAVTTENEPLVNFLLDKGVEINLIKNKTDRYSKKTSLSALDLATYYPIYKKLKEQGAKTAYEILE